MGADRVPPDFINRLQSLGVDFFEQSSQVVVSPTSRRDDNYEALDYKMVCAICSVPLNRFTGMNGEEAWLHSQSWKHFDHEPEPKQIPFNDFQSNVMVCDFCGESRDVIWSLEGNHIQHTVGNLGTDYGTKWAACVPCYELITKLDVQGLIDRIMTMSAMARTTTSPHARAEVRKSLIELHGRFIPTIHTRRYIGPAIEPSRVNPRQMPKMRDGLVKFWQHPELYGRHSHRQVALAVPGSHAGREDTFKHRFEIGDPLPREVFDRHTEHLIAGIRAAEMYWVSEDFTRLAIMAGKDLKDVSISREELPAPFGFLVWADPIASVKRPFGEASLRAATWTLVPGGVWVNTYALVDDADPDVRDIAAARADMGFLISPNLGSGFPFMSLNLERLDGDDHNMQGLAFARTLFATWFLMAQPGVAATSSVVHDKKLIRAANRAGKKLPEVRLIDLRRRPKPAIDGAPHEGPKLKYKRFTRGHWKSQFYGPGRAMRKQIYVSNYIAGADLPWRPDDPPTVKVLR